MAEVPKASQRLRGKPATRKNNSRTTKEEEKENDINDKPQSEVVLRKKRTRHRLESNRSSSSIEAIDIIRIVPTDASKDYLRKEFRKESKALKLPEVPEKKSRKKPDGGKAQSATPKKQPQKDTAKDSMLKDSVTKLNDTHSPKDKKATDKSKCEALKNLNNSKEESPKNKEVKLSAPKALCDLPENNSPKKPQRSRSQSSNKTKPIVFCPPLFDAKIKQEPISDTECDISDKPTSSSKSISLFSKDSSPPPRINKIRQSQRSFKPTEKLKQLSETISLKSEQSSNASDKSQSIKDLGHVEGPKRKSRVSQSPGKSSTGQKSTEEVKSKEPESSKKITLVEKDIEIPIKQVRKTRNSQSSSPSRAELKQKPSKHPDHDDMQLDKLDTSPKKSQIQKDPCIVKGNKLNKRIELDGQSPPLISAQVMKSPLAKSPMKTPGKINLPIKKLISRRGSYNSESELQVVLTKLPDVHLQDHVRGKCSNVSDKSLNVHSKEKSSKTLELVKVCTETDQDEKKFVRVQNQNLDDHVHGKSSNTTKKSSTVQKSSKPMDIGISKDKDKKCINVKEKSSNVPSKNSSVDVLGKSSNTDVHSKSILNVMELEKVCTDKRKSENSSDCGDDSDSDFRKPPKLVCMKDSSNIQEKFKSGDNSFKESPKIDLQVPNPIISSLPDQKAEGTPAKVGTRSKSRLSCESDDSECALVIDLDRRLSVEETGDTPCNTDEKIAPQTPIKVETPETQTSSCATISTDLFPREEDITPPDLSKEIMPAILKEYLEEDQPGAEIDNSQSPEKETDNESILRALLLETADATTNSQDANHNNGEVISMDSKSEIERDIANYMLCNGFAKSDAESLDLKLPLVTELDANGDEKPKIDPRIVLRKMMALNSEIRHLTKLTDQKERELNAILYYKNSKELDMKELMKMFSFKDWFKFNKPPSKDPQRKSLDPTAELSAEAFADLPTHQVLQLAYRALVESEAAAASTSGESGDKLPNVAAMVAEASENYGVDMRTVRNDVLTECTVTSDEAMPLTNQQDVISILSDASSETSTSTSTVTQTLLQKALQQPPKDFMFAPPCLKPETPIPAILPQEPYPLDLIVNSGSKKSVNPVPKTDDIPKPLDMSPGSSKPDKPNQDHSKGEPSRPKRRSGRSSYSVWRAVASSSHTVSSSANSIDFTRGQESLSAKRSSTADSQGFLIAPPPTPLCLPSTSEGQSSRSETMERSLKSSVERIYTRRTDEERHTMSYSTLMPNSYGGDCGKTPGSQSGATCMGCGTPGAKYVCSGCRKHWYCSSQCQTLRWPEHSRNCVGHLYSTPTDPSYIKF